MAKSIDSRDAKRITDQHQGVLDSLASAEKLLAKLRDAISDASNTMLAQEVLQLLKDIPIEEINRDKQGIRVKALREHGFRTVADISTASVYTIASVHGISEDTAYCIKRIVNDIVSKTRQGVKIRLSEDKKTPQASDLVLAISKYRKSLPAIEECKKLYNVAHKDIEYGLKDLAPATNGFRWLFTSKSKKQKSEQAYEMLQGMLEGSYKESAVKYLGTIQKIGHSTNEQAWQDFSSSSIRFFNILEEVTPGILGTDDTVYGLPEALAREIQDQEFFPKGLLCELRRYQEWGVKYILHQERVLLGDEMGLGKTIQAIAAMVSLRNTGATHFVVVCPASVITNWCREIRKASLLSITKIYGAGRKAALQSWEKTGGVAVTTYETTGYFILENDFKFSMLVVDEAHYIKNSTARRSINVVNISRHAERILFMTGTALENKVEEMISLISVLQPSIASSVRGMEFLSSAPQFRTQVAPVYYRRKREDVLTELPELIESKEWCTMTRAEEAVYEDAVLNKRYADARRVSWNAANPADSSKAARMLELIEEAASEGRKIIVFSFFLDTVHIVTTLLGSRCLNPINGAVSPQRRQEIIDEFENAPAGTVLAAQIQSGGTGLNIQTASVVIICEPQFKPSIENQAISRAYRMGQTRNVLVYRLLCEESVDEKITVMLEEKQRIFDAFADKSVAAAESRDLDEKSFGNIIKEEIDRINAKHLEMA